MQSQEIWSYRLWILEPWASTAILTGKVVVPQNNFSKPHTVLQMLDCNFWSTLPSTAKGEESCKQQSNIWRVTGLLDFFWDNIKFSCEFRNICAEVMPIIGMPDSLTRGQQIPCTSDNNKKHKKGESWQSALFPVLWMSKQPINFFIVCLFPYKPMIYWY